MWELRNRKVKKYTPDHMASRWQGWGTAPRSLSPIPYFFKSLTLCLFGITLNIQMCSVDLTGQQWTTGVVLVWINNFGPKIKHWELSGWVMENWDDSQCDTVDRVWGLQSHDPCWSLGSLTRPLSSHLVSKEP